MKTNFKQKENIGNLFKNSNFRNNQNYIINKEIIRGLLKSEKDTIDEYENIYFNKLYNKCLKIIIIFIFCIYTVLNFSNNFFLQLLSVIFLLYFGITFIFTGYRLLFLSNFLLPRRLKYYTFIKEDINLNEFTLHKKISNETK